LSNKLWAATEVDLIRARRMMSGKMSSWVVD
jgi:hypothetical protein